MPVDDLVAYLRILDQRQSWRLHELPPQLGGDVLIELDRFKLIETRLWKGALPGGAPLPQPAPDPDGWYIVRQNEGKAGALSWLMDPRAYASGCWPEFRLSVEGAAWLRGNVSMPRAAIAWLGEHIVGAAIATVIAALILAWIGLG